MLRGALVHALLVHAAVGIQHIAVDPSSPGLRFDGNGALSAGASSRLLIDYPEKERAEILDYLYTPQFGANLHVCKVEIGGDTQSTDGTEPSHMHSEADLNCERGYEFWLMKEAKKRNPEVLTYGLSWGAPGWVNQQRGYYSKAMIKYQLAWVQCAREHHGIELDLLGLWNERPWGNAGYVKELKRALEASNFSTQLVLGDGGMPDIWDSFGHDKEFTGAFGAVGLHYPCEASALGGHGEQLLAAGKSVWASEDWWSESEFGGAVCWGKLLNQNFLRMNVSSTIAWSTVWSVYPQVDAYEGHGDQLSGDGFWGPGLVYAWQPWSGHYVIPPTVWASAHTNQFAGPGWRVLHSSGQLAGGGSFVSYVNQAMDQFATVIETGHALCGHCDYSNQTAAKHPQLVSLELEGGLSGVSEVFVWHTNQTHWFEHVGTLAVQEHTVQLPALPGSIYTLTSTSGQSKGSHPPAPPSARFPVQWSDDFEGYSEQGLARFFADQCGSFQVSLGKSSKVLRQQVLERPGVNQWVDNLLFPISIIGDTNSSDSTVQATMQLPSTTTALQSSRFERRGGRVIGGSFDLPMWLSSVEAAEAFCLRELQCNSFTFEDSSQRGAVNAGETQYWFSSENATSDNSSQWSSYLLTPPRPPAPPPGQMAGSWGGLCTRVSSVKMLQPLAGVCLQVNASDWQLADLTYGLVAGGALPAAVRPTEGVKLVLSTKASAVSAWLGGHKLGSWDLLGPVARGVAAIASGWNLADFDSFQLSLED